MCIIAYRKKDEMNIIDIAKNKDKLLQENLKITCKQCFELYYSPFDRLYMLANNMESIK